MNPWSRVGLVLALVMFAGASFWIYSNHYDWKSLEKAFPLFGMYLVVKVAILVILGFQMSKSGKIHRFWKTLRLDICATGIAIAVIMSIWVVSQIPRFF